MKKILILLLSILFMGCEFIALPPDNAEVILCHSKKEYTSPPCLGRGYSDWRECNEPTTLREARMLGYRPQKECSQQTFGLWSDRGFSQATYPTTNLLRKLGIDLNPSRWNEKGEWRY